MWGKTATGAPSLGSPCRFPTYAFAFSIQVQPQVSWDPNPPIHQDKLATPLASGLPLPLHNKGQPQLLYKTAKLKLSTQPTNPHEPKTLNQCNHLNYHCRHSLLQSRPAKKGSDQLVWGQLQVEHWVVNATAISRKRGGWGANIKSTCPFATPSHPAGSA